MVEAMYSLLVTFFILVWDVLFINMFALILAGKREKLKLTAQNYSILFLATIIGAFVGVFTHFPTHTTMHHIGEEILIHLPIIFPMLWIYRQKSHRKTLWLFVALLASHALFLMAQTFFLEISRIVLRNIQSDITLRMTVMTPVKLWSFFVIGLNVIPYMFCYETKTVGIINGKLYVHPLLWIVLAMNIFFGGLVVLMIVHGIISVSGLPALSQGLILASFTSFPALNFIGATLIIAIHQAKRTIHQVEIKNEIQQTIQEIRKQSTNLPLCASKKKLCNLTNEIVDLVNNLDSLPYD